MEPGQLVCKLGSIDKRLEDVPADYGAPGTIKGLYARQVALS